MKFGRFKCFNGLFPKLVDIQKILLAHEGAQSLNDPKFAKLQQIIDAGTHPESYYDKLLPPTSAQIRRWLLSTIRKETRLLAKIQNSLRHPLLDLFFTFSAILGTHTFFVLLLPTFFWFGYGSLGRGPSSPPIRRLCIGSHHLEYGFPSTHTTNAVSIALFFLTHIYSIESNNVFAGFILAILVWWIHWSFQVHIDAFILNESWSVPVIVITLGISLVYMFPKVIDNCPCIEDCIACIGAAVGMIIGSWNFSNSRFSNNGNVPYDYNSTGFAVTLLRVVF
ncbi:5378_t:CDS:2, partial [Gigaspora margarita]